MKAATPSAREPRPLRNRQLHPAEIISIPAKVMEENSSNLPSLRNGRSYSNAFCDIGAHAGEEEEQSARMQGQMTKLTKQIFRQIERRELKWG